MFTTATLALAYAQHNRAFVIGFRCDLFYSRDDVLFSIYKGENVN